MTREWIIDNFELNRFSECGVELHPAMRGFIEFEPWLKVSSKGKKWAVKLEGKVVYVNWIMAILLDDLKKNPVNRNRTHP